MAAPEKPQDIDATSLNATASRETMTTATSDTSATTNSDPADLESQASILSGKAAEAEGNGDIDTAIEMYAKALELRIEASHERHIFCAPAYVNYSRVLLRKAQADPFGSKISAKEGQENGSGANASASNEADDSAAGGEDDGDDDGPEEEGEEAGEADDLELSFQCLEVARLIYEQAPSEGLRLAEVLELIGEVQMENEVWEEAIKEMEKARDIYEKLLPPEARQLAHIYYQLATATAALVEAKKAESKAHFDHAAEVLQQRIDSLGGQADEVSELRELLSEVKARAEDFAPVSTNGTSAPAPRGSAMSNEAPGATASTGVRSIGFGAGASEVTTIGFGSGAAPALAAPAKDLGVLGGSRKKAVLEPLSTNEPSKHGEAACLSMDQATKKVRVE